jgi:hypothetical protein
VNPRVTSSSAKDFLLHQLLEQAALDKIAFSDFELRLLRENADDPAVDPTALAEFELRGRARFFETVGTCLQKALKRLEIERSSNDYFWRAVKAASNPDDYFSIILWDRFNDELLSGVPFRSQGRTSRDNLVTFSVVLAGCMILIGSILYWGTNGQRWRIVWLSFVSRHPAIAGLHLPYIPWLQNPIGWFQQNAGKYLIMAILAAGIVYWGRFLLQLLRRISERDDL